jgi:hypothetical protein
VTAKYKDENSNPILIFNFFTLLKGEKMKKAKEARRLQKALMQSQTRYKELETALGEAIDRAIFENIRAVSIKVIGEEVPMVVLLAHINGYKWQYYTGFDKTENVSVDITW